MISCTATYVVNKTATAFCLHDSESQVAAMNVAEAGALSVGSGSAAIWAGGDAAGESAEAKARTTPRTMRRMRSGGKKMSVAPSMNQGKIPIWKMTALSKLKAMAAR